jgi:preprotein translocase subunit SecE
MAKTIAVADQQTTGMDRFKSQPQRLMEFLKDVRARCARSSPHSRRGPVDHHVVIVTVFIFAAYFFLVDSSSARASPADPTPHRQAS